MGVLHMIGEGVCRDYRIAVDLFTKCANQGYAIIQQGLDEMYCRGSGVAKKPQDRAEVVKTPLQKSQPACGT